MNSDISILFLQLDRILNMVNGLYDYEDDFEGKSKRIIEAYDALLSDIEYVFDIDDQLLDHIYKQVDILKKQFESIVLTMSKKVN